MTYRRTIRPALGWLGLTALVLSLQGCQQSGWNGIFAIDMAGGARTCVAPTAAPPDGQSVAVPVQMSNDGGWCGVTLNRSGVPYESYLLAARATHGRINAHRVGNNTRIDYTPDPGFTGADTFAVRLIPGNAIVQEQVTVTK